MAEAIRRSAAGPGELRSAEWQEFNLEGKEPEWRIPGAKMKMGEQHIVLLSRQAMAVLTEPRRFTCDGQYLFPSLRAPDRCMSNKHDQCGAAPARLRQQRDRRPRLSGHGVDAAQCA